jgi:hypothetical protein
LKKIIFVLTAATFSLVAMNYASADQGGVVPKLAQVIKQECGEPPATASDLGGIKYDMCVQVTIAKYKGTED